MDVPPETIPLSSASTRRDTISTMSSDRQPSLPSGRWPITIHGNCTRCGHHHKAATIHLHVAAGICEANHVNCDRCGQRWLAVGGLNSTQISLLSTVTTEVDRGEINFRYTLFSMVRSAASIASPTALANVPEDPPSVPSRSPSARNARHPSDAPVRHEQGNPHENYTNSPLNDNVEPGPTKALEDGPIAGYSMPGPPRNNLPALLIIRRKLTNALGMLRNVQFKTLSHRSRRLKSTAQRQGKDSITEPTLQRRSTSPSVISAAFSKNERLEDDHSSPEKTTGQVFEDLEFVNKGTIRNMTPKQRDTWIRERITAYKRSKRSSHFQCDCKRRHSSCSTGVYSLPPRHSASTPAFQRYSLDQMGSQFDVLPPGAFFNHTGPLTISASRISEADTAVEQQDELSGRRSPQHAFRSRLSWQQLRNARTQRNSLDSVLANTTRSSRAIDRLSLASIVPQDISNGSSALGPLSSANMVAEEDPTVSHRIEDS